MYKHITETGSEMQEIRQHEIVRDKLFEGIKLGEETFGKGTAYLVNLHSEWGKKELEK